MGMPAEIKCTEMSCLHNDSRTGRCMLLTGTAYAPGGCPFYKERVGDKGRSCSWMRGCPDDHIGYWGRRHGEL